MDTSDSVDASIQENDAATGLSLRERTYWRSLSAGKLPFRSLGNMGFDVGEPAAPAQTVGMPLSIGTADAVRRVCKGIRELQYCASLAAVAVVLARLVRESDVAVQVAPPDGAGASGRAGVPLWVTLEDGMTGKGLLTRIKDQLAQHAKHRPEAADAVLQGTGEGRWADLRCDTVEADCAWEAGLPHGCAVLRLVVKDQQAQALQFVCPAGEANGHRARGLLNAIDHLLGQLLSNPSSSLDSLSTCPVPGQAEPHAERHERSDVAGAAASFPAYFAELCERHADRAALSDDGQLLTYRQLRTTVTSFAAGVHALGLGGGPVCLRMRRGCDAVVAMLGMLCAGVPYVPVDPAYPDGTLDDAMARTGSRVVIGDAEGAGGTGAFRAISFREVHEAGAAGPAPEVAAFPDRLAYVILTSGSSGSRKAIGVSVANLLYSTEVRTRYYAGCEGRALLLSSISFDSSVAVIFGSLFSGRELFLPAANVEKDPRQVAELIAGKAIGSVLMLPSVLQLVLDGAEPRQLASLSMAIVAGEACDGALVRGFCEKLPRARLFNEYGPTEATVWATVAELSSDRGGQAVTIGLPIAGTRAYVLDTQLHPVPPGCPGELCLAGPGLSWGYLGDTRRTAAGFVPDPFATGGRRMYRTGDLVSRDAAGRLHYHGRIDEQLKIRGHRIEPAEVEALIRQVPGVTSAAVTGHDGAAGRVLIGVFTGTGVDAPSVKEHLRARVPAYLIPDLLFAAQEIPRLPNGKLDRRQLRELIEAGGEVAEPPQDALEQKLHDIWCAVLDRKVVSVEANFFALGGNSIAVAKVINQVQRLINDYLYVAALFEQPTIRGLAGFLKHRYRSRVAHLLEESVPGGAEAAPDRFPLGRADVLTFSRQLTSHGTVGAVSVVTDAPVVFVLAPPRSGTTLMRVILAGNARLFSPPELELCGFDTMGQRAGAFAQGRRFFLEGAVRAVMELRQCSKEEAEQQIAGFEQADAPVGAFYRYLIEQGADRILVDKTASYALDPQALERSRRMFPNALYIHLTRHPNGMIQSFEKARLDLSFLSEAQAWSARQLGELVWHAAHRNLLAFRESLPPSRVLEVSFETLTADPRGEVERISNFIGIPCDEGMLDPYAPGRMTDGVSAHSRMLGDIRFHEHKQIDARVADDWRNAAAPDELMEPTRELARRFGYVPAGEIGRFPLSFQQRQVYLADQMGRVGTYNVPWVLRLEGRCDVAVLERALQRVVDRHAALRTCYPYEDGDIWQRVSATQAVSIDVHAVPGASAEMRRAALKMLLRDEIVGRRFDLARGPVLKARLFLIDAELAYFCLNIHHIACDAWSLARITREFAESIGAQAEPEHDDAAAPYTLYAARQQAAPEQDALSRIERQWDDLLGEPLEPSAFNASGAAGPDDGRLAGNLRFELTDDLSRSLRELASAMACPLSVVFQAALAVLLHQDTGRAEVFMGSPVACRTDARFAATVGNFVNLVVTRATVEPHRAFADLVRQIQGFMTQAQPIQHFPYERLVDRKGRDGGLIQTMFSFQSIAHGRFELPGLRAELEPPESVYAKFPLTILVLDLPTIRCDFEYARARYGASDVDRIGARLVALLEAVAGSPDATIGHLPDVGRPRAVPGAAAASLLEMFEQRAASAPDHPAVVSSGDDLSYAVLRSWAGTLADALATHGIGPGERVAIHLPRGAHYVAAVVAAAYRGAAYVPFNPSQKADVVGRLARVAGCGAVLCVRPDGEYGLSCIPVEPRPGLRIEAPRRAHPGLRIDQLQYVVFTSGSSGAPKGVAVPHSALLNYVNWAHRELALTGQDRMTLANGIGFDTLQGELWSCLTAGATLVLPPGEIVELTPRQTLDWLDRQQVTVAFFLTFVAENLLRQLSDPPPALRLLITGGEALSADVVKAYPFAFANAYGPSETTVLSSYGRLAPDDGGASPGIGAAIDNTDLHVLDEAMQPVPVGEAGELYIGGAGLAWGYVGDTGRTAERFLPDPFSAEAGRRLYRTGDKVSVDRDGRFSFHGRVDDEIKVGGVRANAMLIEQIIANVPGIEKAVVVTVRDGSDAWFEAYVKPLAPSAELADIVRAAVRAEVLHAAHVPARIAIVTEFPYGMSTKIDRTRLRDAVESDARAAQAAPGDPLERRVAQLYATLLHVDDLPPGASFFELGGTSRKALQAVAAINAEWHVSLSLRDFVANASVGACAAWLRSQRAADGGTAPTPSAREEVREDRASYFQEAMYFDSLGDTGRIANHIGMGVRVRGALDESRFEAALGRLAAVHPLLRTCFKMDDHGNVRLVETSAPVLQTLTSTEAAEPVAWLNSLVAMPFSLEGGPLWRAMLVRQRDSETLLLFAFHHIIFDGVSAAIFFEDLQRLYADPESDPRPACEGFAGHAARERRQIADPAGRKRQAWVQALRGYRPVRLDPQDPAADAADRERDEVAVARRWCASTVPGPADVSRGMSAPQLVLAAYANAIRRHCRVDDVVVGLVVNTRTTGQQLGTIGPFLNTLPIRVRFGHDDSTADVAPRVRDAVLEALDAHDIPTACIMADLAAAGDAVDGLLQFTLTWQDFGDIVPGLSGCRCELVKADIRQNKFPLQLFWSPNGEGAELVLRYDRHRMTAQAAEAVMTCIGDDLPWLSARAN